MIAERFNRVCGWCRENMTAEPIDSTIPTTHGICPRCVQGLDNEDDAYRGVSRAVLVHQTYEDGTERTTALEGAADILRFVGGLRRDVRVRIAVLR